MSTTDSERVIESLRAERDRAIAERDAERARFGEMISARDAVIADIAKKLRLTQEELEYVKRRLFGRKSEKGPLGPTLFDLAGVAPEPAAPPLPVAAPDDEGSTLPVAELRQGARRRNGRRALPAKLVRHRVEIPLPEDERCCGECDEERVRIGEDVTEVLHFVPEHYEVVQIVRGRYACPNGDGGVVTPAVPPRPIPASYADHSVLADVLVAKYADHLPLNRKARIMRRAGLDVTRSTLCDWVAGATAVLAHVADAIRRGVLSGGYVQADETPVKVQTAEPGPPRTGYFYAYRDVATDQVFYDFRMSRSRDGPSQVLAGFRGALQIDGYQGYEEVIAARELVVLHCMAHARRGVFESLDSAPNEAAILLVLLRRLYAVEKDAREMTADERKEERRRRSRPVLAELARTLRRMRPTTSPGSRLGKAITYILERWRRLTRYLCDGRYEIDSNGVEHAMRGIAMGRKAWLFCGSAEGGRRAAVIYTVIESCRRAGGDPFAYLSDVLERLPTTPLSQVAELTPRRWAQARRG